MTEPPIHTGVDEVAPHPRHTGHHWLDMTLGLSAIAISLISLFVAIAHGKTEEKLVAASSWPFVVYDINHNILHSGSWLWVLNVSNSGVGPARIKSARVLLDGKPVHNHEELLASCCGYPSADLTTQVHQGLGDANAIVGVLTARDTITVLSVQQTPATLAQWAKLSALESRLQLFACYCSVLDECWTSDLRSTADPERVADCRAGPDDYAY